MTSNDFSDAPMDLAGFLTNHPLPSADKSAFADCAYCGKRIFDGDGYWCHVRTGLAECDRQEPYGDGAIPRGCDMAECDKYAIHRIVNGQRLCRSHTRTAPPASQFEGGSNA